MIPTVAARKLAPEDRIYMTIASPKPIVVDHVIRRPFGIVEIYHGALGLQSFIAAESHRFFRAPRQNRK